MKSFLLAILLLQTAPQNVGVVTGVVRGANGMPSAGVRVYAMGVRDTIESASLASPFESLSETDGSGRYRLDIAPGRYYIASGSVSAPTFYPGTLDAAMARVVTVSAGAIVEAIDFSSFVPATRMPTMGSLPVGTAVLSGVIRFPDGSPAARIPVTAVPASQFAGGLAPAAGAAPGGSIILPSPSAVIRVAVSASNLASYMIAFASARQAVTDVSGGYVLPNLPTDTFYIAAGFAESPTFFPGVSNTLAAKSITTTPTTNLTSLDFTVPRPPAVVTVTGRATALEGVPADGATIEIRSAPPGPPAAFGLPTLKPTRTVSASADGSFEITGVSPGLYTLNASFSGVRAETRNIVVADQPLRGLDFSFRLASLSGRISAEDGGAFADARAFIDAIVTTVDNPNLLASTLLPISSDGTFSRILEPGNYRFYLRTLAEEYSIKSMTAGGVDLLRETLRFNGEPMTVDVRVTKRAASSDPSAVGVKGRALDSVTGTPSPAARVTLCCRDSGPVERFSAPLGADGSFEFAAIPPGRYAVGLERKEGQPNLFTVAGDIDVESQGAAALEVLSTPQFGELAAAIVYENGDTLSLDSAASVVFTGSGGRTRVVSRRVPDGTYIASLPIGDRYGVSVLNLPDGHAVKSITGPTEARPANYPAVGVPAPLIPIIITLTRTPR